MGEAPTPGTISAEKLCELTGLTDRRHRQIAGEGYFPPPVKSSYQLAATLKGLFKYFNEQLHGKGRASITEEKLRKLRGEADRIELENLKFRGALVDVDDFLKRWEGTYTGMRQKIMNSSLKDHEKDSLLASLSELHG